LRTTDDKAKFTGQERDSETGLDYFQARYFGGALGRFTSPDPTNAGADLANPQSWNGYAYVMNNPLNSIDPFGLDRIDCAGVQSDACVSASPDPIPSDPCLYFDCGIGGGYGGGYQPPPPPPPPTSTVTVIGNPPKSGNAQNCVPGIPCHQQAIHTNPVPVTGFQFCGAGAFAYGGRPLDAGPVNGFAGVIVEADSTSGVSRGALFEIGGGEGYMGGVGKIVSPSAKGLGNTNLAYGGVGGGVFGAHAAGGAVAFSSGAGVFGEISAGGREVGIGAYLDVAKTGGCPTR